MTKSDARDERYDMDELEEFTEEDVAMINGFIPGLRTPQERRI